MQTERGGAVRPRALFHHPALRDSNLPAPCHGRCLPALNPCSAPKSPRFGVTIKGQVKLKSTLGVADVPQKPLISVLFAYYRFYCAIRGCTGE